MKILKKLTWISVDEASPGSYQEILILVHKHSMKDWQIVVGWIEPIDDYTDFKIMAKPNGLGSHYPDVEIPREEVIAIAQIIPSYGYITD